MTANQIDWSNKALAPDVLLAATSESCAIRRFKPSAQMIERIQPTTRGSALDEFPRVVLSGRRNSRDCFIQVSIALPPPVTDGLLGLISAQAGQPD